MTWLFSPALVAAFSRASSSGGEPSAQLSGMPTAQPFWHNDKPMELANLSRFGRTCAVLTADRGAELLTWYLAGFPARTSAQQAAEPASKVSDPACGWKWPGSSAKYDPASRSWKTRQSSLLGGLGEFSETWPRWGSMRDGELLPLPTLELRTSANGSGFWPTPVAQDDNKSPEAHMAMKQRMKGGPRKTITSLQVAAKSWATPCTPNGGRVNRPEDIAANGMRSDGRKVQVSLEAQAKAWATPAARDHFPAHTPEYIAEKRSQGHGMRNLTDEVKAWGTPRATDGDKGGPNQKFGAGGQPLAAQAAHHLGQTESRSSDSTELRGSLSPEFHLWLMGWPEGWTALEPLEMDKYRSWLLAHGGC